MPIPRIVHVQTAEPGSLHRNHQLAPGAKLPARGQQIKFTDFNDGIRRIFKPLELGVNLGIPPASSETQTLKAKDVRAL